MVHSQHCKLVSDAVGVRVAMDIWSNVADFQNKDEDEVEWACLVENFDQIDDEMGLQNDTGSCDVKTISSLFAPTPQGNQCPGVDYTRRNPGQNADPSIAMLLCLPANVKRVLPATVATVLDNVVHSDIDKMFQDYDGGIECNSLGLGLCSDKSTRCRSPMSSLASSNEMNTGRKGQGGSGDCASSMPLKNKQTLEERRMKRLIKNRLSAQKSRNVRMEQDLKNKNEIENNKVEIEALHKKIKLLEFHREETNKNYKTMNMVLRRQNEALVRENMRLKCASDKDIDELKTEIDANIQIALAVQVAVQL